MGFRAVLAVCLLFIACANADEGGVKFWKKNVTMICPGEGSWYEKQGTWTLVSVPAKSQKYEVEYNNNKKEYYCTPNATTKYQFYVQGKVCENCFELDASIFLFALAVDMVLTVAVMFIIYFLTKKKSPDESSSASYASRSGSHPPPIPNPDYEALNPHTQNQDPYSRLGMTR